MQEMMYGMGIYMQTAIFRFFAVLTDFITTQRKSNFLWTLWLSHRDWTCSVVCPEMFLLEEINVCYLHTWSVHNFKLHFMLEKLESFVSSLFCTLFVHFSF